MGEAPLSDITIIDFTQVRAGPWSTQILGKLGAEVIKIERPGTGARERQDEPKQAGFSATHLSRNRDKKSVVLDLKSDRGREIAHDLTRDADVVVENFGPGAMERLGLDYETLSADNPGLIFASIKGYGEEGPHSHKKGVDLIMQAEGGIMSVTGPEGGPPVKVGQAIGDIGAGLYNVIGILTALYNREQTGEGQKFSTDLFGAIVSFLEEYIPRYEMTGENPTPYGRRHQTTVPYEVAETKDGYVAFYPAGGEDDWERFATEVIGSKKLLEYDSREERMKNYMAIAAEIHPVLKEKTTEEWMDIFDDLNWPNGPLNEVSDVIEHPQAQALDYVKEFDHEEAGEITLHGHPLHFSDSESKFEAGAPKLGQHTDEVLETHLGIDAEEVETLREEDVVE